MTARGLEERLLDGREEIGTRRRARRDVGRAWRGEDAVPLSLARSRQALDRQAGTNAHRGHGRARHCATAGILGLAVSRSRSSREGRSPYPARMTRSRSTTSRRPEPIAAASVGPKAAPFELAMPGGGPNQSSRAARCGTCPAAAPDAQRRPCEMRRLARARGSSRTQVRGRQRVR